MKKQSGEAESEDEKQRREVKSEEKGTTARMSEERRSTRANVRQVANRCVFAVVCRSAGSKSTLAKAAGAEVAAQSRQEKLHAAMARSTFASQNTKKLTALAHFWKLGCEKMARRCDAKHICKSKR